MKNDDLDSIGTGFRYRSTRSSRSPRTSATSRSRRPIGSSRLISLRKEINWRYFTQITFLLTDRKTMVIFVINPPPEEQNFQVFYTNKGYNCYFSYFTWPINSSYCSINMNYDQCKPFTKRRVILCESYGEQKGRKKKVLRCYSPSTEILF